MATRGVDYMTPDERCNFLAEALLDDCWDGHDTFLDLALQEKSDAFQTFEDGNRALICCAYRPTEVMPELAVYATYIQLKVRTLISITS